MPRHLAHVYLSIAVLSLIHSSTFTHSYQFCHFFIGVLSCSDNSSVTYIDDSSVAD